MARWVFALMVLLVTGAQAKQTVVVTLFDGFTPEMMELANTPNFDALKTDGTWSDHLIPVFPSISLTNHTSYITGCWPENHGLVNNKFYDPERGLYDHSDDADWRTGCDALFEAVEKQGLKAAALGYAGRKSSTQGALASIISPEAKFEDFPQDPGRAEEVLELLDKPAAERPDLIVAYFRGPDGNAHFKGIDAPETIADVETADRIIGKIRGKLATLAVVDDVALFVGTDHGMKNVTHMVNIGRIMRRHAIDGVVASSGTNAFIYLNDPTQANEIHKKLEGHDAFDAYVKGSFPDYAHIGDGPRAPDILLAAKPPHALEDVDMLPGWVHWLGLTWIWPDTFSLFGGLVATHGYDPAMPEMHGIFYAWGSRIPQGQELDQVQIIDVHPTVLSLMGLSPTDHIDGKTDQRVLDIP